MIILRMKTSIARIGGAVPHTFITNAHHTSIHLGAVYRPPAALRQVECPVLGQAWFCILCERTQQQPSHHILCAQPWAPPLPLLARPLSSSSSSSCGPRFAHRCPLLRRPLRRFLAAGIPCNCGRVTQRTRGRAGPFPSKGPPSPFGTPPQRSSSPPQATPPGRNSR